MAITSPDWYDDLFVDGQLRCWDGRQWTERTRSGIAPTDLWADWVLLALVFVGVIGVLATTDQPSWLVGLLLMTAVGVAVATVIRKHASQH